MALFTVTEHDRKVYEEELRDFLPGKIFDIHTHVYLKELMKRIRRRRSPSSGRSRGPAWWPRTTASRTCRRPTGCCFPGRKFPQ